MAYRIQIRSDTAANWTSTNPTLAQGELGYETDTTKHKIGDGSTAWSSLAYATQGEQGIQGVPGDSALPAPYTANISGAYTIDATKPVQVLTVTGDVAVTLPEPPEGKTVGLSVKIIQDGTGHAVTIPSGTTDVQCTWGESVPPDISTDPGSRHALYFVSDPDEGIWDGYVSALNQGMSS